MTALEFLTRLQQLPSATALRLPHVAATLEMLASILTCTPKENVEREKRWGDEAALAQWLGEPVSTIEGWRLDGAGARKYRLKAILDWLDGHMIPLASTDEEQARRAVECWARQIPALVVNDRLIGFFRSLDLETEPQGHVLVQDDDVRAYVTAKITPADPARLLATYQALGAFSQQLAFSPDESLKTWERIRPDLPPELKLQFFLAAVSRNYEVAMKIVTDLDAVFLRSRWNLTGWMWELFLNNEFKNLSAQTLLSACTFAIGSGINLNAVKSWKDSLGYPVFNGTAAHLLADAYGDYSKLNLQDGFGLEAYNQLLTGLLEQQLDVDLPNQSNLTAHDISTATQKKRGCSHFGRVLDSCELFRELSSSLPNRSGTQRRKQPV